MQSMPIIGQALGMIGTAGQTLAQVGAAEGRAKAAEQEAASIEQEAAFEERQAKRRSDILMAKGRAIGAASGVDISSGSPLLLDLDNARQAMIERLAIRRQGQLGAAGKRYEATLERKSKVGILFGGLAQLGGQGAQLGQSIYNARQARQPSVLSTWYNTGGGWGNYGQPGHYYE